MPTRCDVHKKPDGTVDFLRNGELIHASIPEKGLERQLAPYGILEGTYRDVMRQLAETGEATVEIPLVKMRQVDPPTF